MALKRVLENVVNVFYPKLCLACESETYSGIIPVCVRCINELPIANLHKESENLITERLLGRIEAKAAGALFYFTKKGKVQHLIHQAKYSGDAQISKLLGNWMGRLLMESDLFNDIDVVVPVPLHYSKIKTRGYNQSAEFGRGISEILNKPVLNEALKRNRKDISQTSKNRIDRLTNVHSSFELNNVKGLENKHILLVDDVLTTGATIEACAEKLTSIEGTSISICVMAIVMD